MAAESALTADHTSANDRPNTIVCDQAIFSSVRTAVGQGYRIIAASKGVTQAERRDITSRSPSHGGFCETGPESAAVAFYRLGTRRLCVACSRDAGAEHTGRGVRRIYTHLTLLDEERFAAFGFNPFNVVQAVAETGMLEVQLQPPQVLEALTLDPLSGFDEERVNALLQAVGPKRITHALARVLAGKRVVAGGEFNPGDWIEALLVGLPGPVRADVSFSAGLRYSVGRAYTVTAVTGDLKQTRRLARGQRTEFIEPDGEVPEDFGSSWLQAVARRFADGRCREIGAITARYVPDCTCGTFDRIGDLCNDADEARDADLARLFELADRHVDAAASSEVEAELRSRLLLAVQSRLCDRLRQWDSPDSYWPDIGRLLGQSQAGAEFAVPIAIAVLERLLLSDPVQAAAYGLEAAQRVVDPGSARQLTPALQRVLDRVDGWLPTADPDALARASSVLTEWQFNLPQFESAGEVIARIQTALGQPNS